MPPLARYGDIFVREAEGDEELARLMAAIGWCETRGGLDGEGPKRNNDFGLMVSGGTLRSFPSREAAIRYLANLLRGPLYLGDGRKTVRMIGARYCPVEAANDPHGKNRHWVPCVSECYRELGGTRFLGREDSTVSWRVAGSLLKLRDQIDAAWPRRNRASDGTIGDAAHRRQGASSDHNPWVDEGVVTALDITHDPDNGPDCNRIAEALVASRDRRIKYIIWNRRIVSATREPWKWRPYSGSNPHTHHLHLSVVPEKSLYDSRAPWAIDVEEEWEMPPWVGDWLEWVVLHGRNPKKRPKSVPKDLRAHNEWLQPLGEKVAEITKQVATK